jgi:hypothetical protein
MGAKQTLTKFCIDRFFLLPKVARENRLRHIDSEARELLEAVTHLALRPNALVPKVW